jgi:hypothetical protein
MSWQCFFQSRKILRYLEGEIPPHKTMRLEKHLVDCWKCKELFVKLKAGHQAGRQYGQIGPVIDHGSLEFEELWAAISTKLEGQGRPNRTVVDIIRGLYLTPAFRVFITIVLAGSIIFFVFNRKAVWRADKQVAFPVTLLQYLDFTPVRITEFAFKNQSTIVTEGFVHNIYFDEKEKTLHIKLVEFQHKSEPFVICEILSPNGMTIPKEGNLIRVYGMARYDAQPGRGWHEVNPVLKMAVLKQ